MKYIKPTKINKSIIIIFIFSFFPKVFLSCMQNPIFVADECAMLAVPAYFADYNWSGLVSDFAYYGPGYHILFTPLFKLTNNPFFIYRTILCSYVLLQTFQGIIAYHILKKYFHIKNEYYLCISGLISTYFVLEKATRISNEIVLSLLTWILILILLKLYEVQDNKVKKNVYTIMVVIVLAYSITVHLRSIALTFALVATIIIYYLVRKKWIVSISAFILSGFIMFFIAISYNKFMQNLVWIVNENSGTLHNTNVFSGVEFITKLFNPEYWQAWLGIILGQINTFSITSSGIIIVTIIICIYIILKTIFKRSSAFSKDKIENIDIYFIPAFFLIVCLIITLGGQSITWLQHAYNSLQLGYGSIDDPNTNFARVFTYLRYFSSYTEPIIIIGLAAFYNEFALSKKCWNWGGVAVSLLQVYWCIFLLPYVYKIKSIATVFIPFSFKDYVSPAGFSTYLPATLITLFVFFICRYLFFKNKRIFVLCLVGIILFFQYAYYGIVHENEWYKRGDSGYDLIRELEAEVELPSQIYVPYPAMAYEYQVLLCDYEIICAFPEDDVENAIVFTNRYVTDKDYRYNEYLVERDYLYCRLDDNEYVYVKGSILQEEVRSAGVNLNAGVPFYKNIPLSSMYSKNSKSANTDVFISDGDAGYLLFGPYYSFATGTYSVSLKTKLNSFKSESLGKLSVTADLGQVLVNEKELTLDSFNTGWNEITINFSVLTRLDNVEFCIYTSEGVELEVSEIICEKISPKYNLGLDNRADLLRLKNDISIKDNEAIYCLDELGDISIEFINNQLSDSIVFPATFTELNSLNKPAYVIVPKSYLEWFQLLDRYTIIDKFDSYLLMVSTKDIIRENQSNITMLSAGRRVCFDIWKEKKNSLFTEGKYSNIPAGIYEATLKIDMDSNEGTEVQVSILMNRDTTSLIAHNNNGEITIPIKSFDLIDSLEFEVYNNNRKVKCIPLDLVQLSDSLQYENDFYLKPLLKIVKDSKEINLVISSTIDSAQQIFYVENYVKSYLKNCNLHFVEELEESTNSDYIILKSNSKEMFNLLKEYTIIERTKEYSLLVNKKLQVDALNEYSFGEYVKPYYYRYQLENEVNDTIDLPGGVYSLLVSLDLSKLDKQTSGIVQVYSNNMLLNESSITTEALADESMEIVVSSPNNIDNLRIYICDKDNSYIWGDLIGIKRILDGYLVDLKAMGMINAEYINGVIHSHSDQSAVIYGPYTFLEAGKYEVTWKYDVASNRDIVFEVTSQRGDSIIASANSLDFVEDGTVTVDFELEVDVSGVEFRSWVPENIGFSLKYIHVNKVE